MYSQKVSAFYGATLAAFMFCGCGLNATPTLPKEARQGLGTTTVLYDFEAGIQGWANDGNDACPNLVCTPHWIGSGCGQTEVGPTFEGFGAMRYHVNNTGGNGYFAVSNYDAVNIPNGSTVNFAVWLPKGAKSNINGIQAFVKTGPNFDFNKQYLGNFAIVEDAWTLLGVLVPPNAATPITGIGVAFDMSSTMNDDIYIDSITVQN